jgi:YD repeat-containing protein
MPSHWPLLMAVAAGYCAAQSNYTYDSGGRLVKVTYGASGSVVYTYDAAGNLIGRSVVSAAGSMITSVNTAGGGPNIAQNTWIEIRARISSRQPHPRPGSPGAALLPSHPA